MDSSKLGPSHLLLLKSFVVRRSLLSSPDVKLPLLTLLPTTEDFEQKNNFDRQRHHLHAPIPDAEGLPGYNAMKAMKVNDKPIRLEVRTDKELD